MEERYIKCSTSVIGSPIWHDDGVSKLYFYFQCKASHNAKNWCGLTVNQGELPLSERNAAVELEWSRSKFLRKLEQLKDTGLISVQTSEAGTLIRLTYWKDAGGLKAVPCGIEMRPHLEQYQNDTTVSSRTSPVDSQWSQNETTYGIDTRPGGLKTRPNQYISNTKLNTLSLPEVPEAFTQIWLAYPPERRTCRDEAICLFRKAMEDGATVDAMIAALEADKSSYTWSKEGGRYIPGIVKWLQKETWRDYLIAAPAEEEEIWTSR